MPARQRLWLFRTPEMKIRTLIVDDEAPARARLRQLLRFESDFDVIGECGNGRQAVAAIQKPRPDARKPERLAFKANGRVIFVRVGDIEWIEADGNYVRMHVGAIAHQLRETIGGMETQLPSDRFMRISRSAIVNMDRIKELQPMFYGDYAVILQNGARLNMSRNFRDRLEKLLGHRR